MPRWLDYVLNCTPLLIVASQSEAAQPLLVKKWSMLCEMEMVGEKGVFVFSSDGSLTDTELYTTLKVPK